MPVDGKPKVIGWEIFEDIASAVFTLDGEELFSCSVNELKNFISLGLEAYGALRSIAEQQATLGNLGVVKEAEEVLRNLE